MKIKRLCFFLPLLIVFLGAGCSLFESFEEEGIEISSLRLNRNELTATSGSLCHLSVTISPADAQKNINPEWSYDDSLISVTSKNNYGITFKGIAEGECVVSCSYGGITDSCIVTLTAAPTEDATGGGTVTERQNNDQYIYSNTSILQMTPGGREKVFVSLYGGNAGDVDGYTWTIENPSVATIQPTGQYCIIEAKSKGYTRIKITHVKASYPYYIGVYIFQEDSNTYITTGDNIITMNQTEPDRRVSVSLVNGLQTSSDNSFQWEIISEPGDALPVSINSMASNAVIHPLRGGTCTVRVSHPDAPYPLDILCRVVVVVRNVYIETDTSVLSIKDTNDHTVTALLKNTESMYSMNSFAYSIDNAEVAEIASEAANKVIIRPKANGFCKLVVSHPLSEYDKEVLVSVTGQATNAGANDRILSVSTNYIRTKAGAAQVYAEAYIEGGGGEDKFEWSATQKPASGSGNVISVEAVRNAVYITPIAEGSSVITVTHPRAAASQEILVKVLKEDAILELEELLYFQGSGILKILNGYESEYTVSLNGENKSPNDEQQITWTMDDPRISLLPDGTSCVVTAPAEGSGTVQASMTISHPKAEDDKTVTIITADDEETLNSIKILVTNKSFYNLNIGDEDMLGFTPEGFAEDEFDGTKVNWSVNYPEVLSISTIDNSPALCHITCRKAGDAKVTARYESLTCTFTVHVYPAGTMNVAQEAYFVSDSNYISIYQLGGTAKASLHAPNLATAKYQDITWFTADSSIIQLYPNGTECTVKGLSPGNATIIASHPDSVNTLKFYVAVCGQLPSPDDDEIRNTESLSCQQNYIQTVVGGRDEVVTVNLHNLGAGAENELVWTLTQIPDNQGEGVIKVVTPTGTIGGNFYADNTPVTNKKTLQHGKIAVQPLNPGTATITVRHPQAKNSVSILVKVQPAGYQAEESLYFSGSNIITFTNDKPYFLSVMLNGLNKADGDESSITWLCDNNDYSVLANGQNAMIMCNVPGISTATITVSHPKVRFPKSILIISADNEEQLSSARAIYMTSTSYNLNAGETLEIPLRFYGYGTVDENRIVWSSSSPEIASVNSGTVRGLKPGYADIRASYLTSSVSARVFVYPADIPVENDPTEASGSGGSSEGGGINITVRSDDLKIDSSRSGKSVTFTVREEGYDSFMWLLDDENINETSRTFTLNTAELAEGSYDLVLFASRGTSSYSAYIQINVHQ